MNYFRELVVELLTNSARQKSEALKQSFHIRVGSALCQEMSSLRVCLGKLAPHLTQKVQLILVVLVETQFILSHKTLLETTLGRDRSFSVADEAGVNSEAKDSATKSAFCNEFRESIRSSPSSGSLSTTGMRTVSGPVFRDVLTGCNHGTS
jgi:hypothetical protein